MHFWFITSAFRPGTWHLALETVPLVRTGNNNSIFQKSQTALPFSIREAISYHDFSRNNFSRFFDTLSSSVAFVGSASEAVVWFGKRIYQSRARGRNHDVSTLYRFFCVSQRRFVWRWFLHTCVPTRAIRAHHYLPRAPTTVTSHNSLELLDPSFYLRFHYQRNKFKIK